MAAGRTVAVFKGSTIPTSVRRQEEEDEARGFLEEMELVVPWKALLKVIAPFYPAAGRGRRPYPL